MNFGKKYSFFDDSQIKFFVLFFLLSIIIHAYLFMFSYYSIMILPKDDSKNKELKVQNIILETHKETLNDEKEAMISDKNNKSAALEFDTNKIEKYNIFNPDPGKSFLQRGEIDFTGKEETKETVEDSFVEKTGINGKKIAFDQKKQNSAQTKGSQGSSTPTLFDPNQIPVINLYNNGAPNLSTQSKEYAEYFLKMQKKIEKYHREFFPIYQYYQGLISSGVVVIEYIVDVNGDVVEPKVVESYGSSTVDNASLNSIIYSKNFDPLPKELAEYGKIKINFHFVYVAP